MDEGQNEKPIATTNDVSNEPVGKSEKMFSLKKWNAVAMWSWDVECDTCAICRVQLMGRQIFSRYFAISVPKMFYQFRRLLEVSG